MLLAPTTPQRAALSAMLNTSSIEGLLDLGSWAGSSHDLRLGAHYQHLDIDPRDPDWLASLSASGAASA